MSYNQDEKHLYQKRSLIIMSIIVDFQLSTFCNCHIEPSSDVITLLLSEINKLKKYEVVPSIITGQTIDLNTKQVGRVSNLTFTTLEQSCRIVCLDDRIDVNIRGKLDGPAILVKEELQFAKSVIKIIQEKLSIAGNRLAFNVSVMSESFDSSFLETNIAKKLYVPMKYYNEKDIHEWEMRVNSRESIDINGNEEHLNIITQIASNEQTNKENRILLHIDINTLAQNVEYRFTSQSLDDFSDKALGIYESIVAEFED